MDRMAGAESEITIACIQMEPIVGAKQANLANSLKRIDEAAREGARLIVLPELANSGYVFRDREEAFALAEEVPGGETTAIWIDSAQRHLPLLLQKKALIEAGRAGVTDARHAYLPASYLGDEVSVGTDNALPGSYYSFGLIPSVSSGITPSNNYQAAGGNIAFLFNEYELVNFGLKKATVRRAEADQPCLVGGMRPRTRQWVDGFMVRVLRGLCLWSRFRRMRW